MVQKDEPNQYLAYEGSTAQNAAGQIDVLSVQIYSAPQYGGPTTPGTYSLEGSNYETCGLCVLIYAGCDSSSCAKTYFADEGSVTITELDGSFAATLNGVKLKEVTINPVTFASTPVPGGELWCLDGTKCGTALNTRRWKRVDGRRPHCVMPLSG